MPSTHTSLRYHLIFSTKNRSPIRIEPDEPASVPIWAARYFAFFKNGTPLVIQSGAGLSFR